MSPASGPEPAPARNPAVKVIQIVVLVLAAMVIGMLIMLLVTQGDDEASASLPGVVMAAASTWPGAST